MGFSNTSNNRKIVKKLQNFPKIANISSSEAHLFFDFTYVSLRCCLEEFTDLTETTMSRLQRVQLKRVDFLASE